jgi:hypothetical protein
MYFKKMRAVYKYTPRAFYLQFFAQGSQLYFGSFLLGGFLAAVTRNSKAVTPARAPITLYFQILIMMIYFNASI